MPKPHDPFTASRPVSATGSGPSRARASDRLRQGHTERSFEAISPEFVIDVLRSANLVGLGRGLHLAFLPRNPERRDYLTQAHFRVIQGGKPLCYLTIGKNLGDLRRRSEAFAKACPAIACRPLFWRQSSGWDFLGSEFFDGIKLDNLVLSGKTPAGAAVSMAERVIVELERTFRPSSPESMEAELQRLFDRVCSCSLFSGVDRSFLQGFIFPFVRAGALSESPRTRWSNGDFIARNLLVDTFGNFRLVDYEFASRTHFFEEDRWRWRTFTTLPAEGRELPRFGDVRYSRPWTEALFILRQMVLAQEVNGSQIAVDDARQGAERLKALASEGYSRYKGSVFLRPLANPTPPARSPTISTVAQLYWSCDGVYSEEFSLRSDYDSDVESSVRFPIRQVSGCLRLRFDPAMATGLLEITAVRVRRTDTAQVLLSLNETTGWDKVRLNCGLMRLADSPFLNLLSLNTDPSLELPEIEIGAASCDVVCDIWLTFKADMTALPVLALRPTIGLPNPAARAGIGSEGGELHAEAQPQALTVTNEEHESLADERTQLQRELLEAQQALIRAEQRSETLSGQLSELDLALQSHTDALTQQEKMRAEAEARSVATAEELAEVRAEATAHADACHQLRADLLRTQQDLAKSHDEAAELAKQASALQSDLQSQGNVIARQDRDLVGAHEENKTIAEELHHVRQSMASAQAEFERRRNELSYEFSRVERDLAARETELTGLRSQHAQLQNTLVQTQAARDKLIHQIEEQQSLMSGAELEATQANHALRALQPAHDDLQGRFIAIANQCSALERTNVSITAATETLRGDLRSAHAYIAGLTAALAASQAGGEEHVRKHAELQGSLACVKSDLAAAQQSSEHLTAELERTHQECVALREQVALLSDEGLVAWVKRKAKRSADLSA